MTNPHPKKGERKKQDSIENPRKEQIEEFLSEIGWSLRHHGCDHWGFYNHKKQFVGMYLLFPDSDARIEFENTGRSYHHRKPAFYFWLKQVVMNRLDRAVSFRGKTDNALFILCPNYD